MLNAIEKRIREFGYKTKIEDHTLLVWSLIAGKAFLVKADGLETFSLKTSTGITNNLSSKEVVNRIVEVATDAVC